MKKPNKTTKSKTAGQSPALGLAHGSHKPFKAYMAFNHSNPWENTCSRRRRDCIAATKENLINPETDFRDSFTVRKVLVTVLPANTELRNSDPKKTP